MTLNLGEPAVLVNCHYHYAEKPLWHPQHKLLYWTDIPNGRLFRYDPTYEGYEQIYLGEPVGGFTLQADGSLLLFKIHGTVEIWDKGELRTVVPEIESAKGTRFNDAIADPAGRVFSGTVFSDTVFSDTIADDNTEGRLYRIDTDGSVHEVVQDLILPSGMDFSLDYKHLYVTDSKRRTIYRFDYDSATGELANQTELIKTPIDDGMPDGLTVDSEGYLWSARWNGSGVYRYSPEGKEVQCVALPTPKVSGVTFGGEDCTQLFISSAREDYEIGLDNVAGDVFHLPGSIISGPIISSPIKGRPALLSRVAMIPSA